MKLKSTGRVYVSNSACRIIVDNDLLKYYRYFIHKRWFGAKTNLPKHGPHITISNKKLHGNVNYKKIKKKWGGKKVDFTYDPYINMGGHGRPYKNFWLKVDCPDAQQIAKDLNIKQSKGFLGYHITICNTKNI